MARGGFELGKVFVGHAGGADDMDAARLCSQPGELDGGRGRGEIDDGMGLCDHLERIVADGHVERRATHGGADILPDPVMAFAFDHADQLGPVAFHHGADQHLAHPARGARHHYARHIAHLVSLQFALLPSLPHGSSLGKTSAKP